MFKSRFAREMQQFSSLSEEIFCSRNASELRSELHGLSDDDGVEDYGVGNDNQVYDDEHHHDYYDDDDHHDYNGAEDAVDRRPAGAWIDSEHFKKILDISERLEKEEWEGGGGGDGIKNCTIEIKSKDDVRKSSPVIDITGSDLIATGGSDTAGLFVNRHSDHVITDRRFAGSGKEIRKFGTVGKSAYDEQNVECDELWEQGGRRVEELSKMFENTEGGSSKTKFPSRSLSRVEDGPSSHADPLTVKSELKEEDATERHSQSSRPAPRRTASTASSSRHSASRPGSPNRTLRSSASRPGSPRMRSTPKARGDGKLTQNNSKLSTFIPPEGVDLSIDGIHGISADETGKTGSTESDKTGLNETTPRPVFKLEPYTPRTPISQISKVETVVSLGEPQMWQRKESSIQQLEVEVERLREENRRLVEQLEVARDSSGRYTSLEKELEQLQWQLTKMEDSRKMYEKATTQLVSFLDLVSEQLSGIAPTPPSAAAARLADGLPPLPFPTSLGSKTRLSLGGETLTPASAAAIAGSRLSLAGLTGTSRRRAKDPDLDTSSRMSLASSSTSRLGAADLRELALLRELDALREVNMAASSDLGASRLSLAPSDLSSRLVNSRREMLACRPARLSDIPRSKSVMAISGLSETDLSTTSTLGRPSRPSRPTSQHSRKQRLNASQPSAQEFTKLRRKTPTSVEPVWRRSDGSEGGASLESKDSGRSTDSCSSGRSSPKQDRQQLAGRARRMVRAVKQFLAREKNKYPNQRSSENPNLSETSGPWILKEKENIPTTSTTTSINPATRDTQGILEDERKPSNAGRVVIRIRPERGILSPANRTVSADEIKLTKGDMTKTKDPSAADAVNNPSTPTTKKSFSFSHSTPRRSSTEAATAASADSNMIKITNMGTVSVPVPYPVVPDKQWF